MFESLRSGEKMKAIAYKFYTIAVVLPLLRSAYRVTFNEKQFNALIDKYIQ